MPTALTEPESLLAVRTTRIRIWDAATCRLLRTLEGHSDQPRDVAFSADGDILVSGGADGTVRLWNSQSGESISTFELENGKVSSIATSPAGLLVAAGGEGSWVHIWDGLTGEKKYTLRQSHETSVHSVAFSADGERLVSCCREKAIGWDPLTGEEVFRRSFSNMRSAALNPATGDSSDMAFGFFPSVIAGNPVVGKVRWHKHAHKSGVWDLAFSPNGQKIASAGQDEQVIVRDARTGDVLQTIKGHSSAVRQLAFSPDGTQLATASNDHTLKLWDLTRPQETHPLPGHEASVYSVAYSPDGRILASGDIQGMICVRDAESLEVQHTFRGARLDLFRNVSIHPDSTLLAAPVSRYEVAIWDLSTGVETQRWEAHEKFLWNVRFSPDGKHLATSGYDDAVRVWNIETGTKVVEHQITASCLAFSPDGKQLAAGGSHVMIWDAMDADSVRRQFQGHELEVTSIHFSPDGEKLVTSSKDRTVILWSIETGKRLQTLKGHADFVFNARFSPDGDRVISSGRDGALIVWDSVSGRKLLDLKGHKLAVWDAMFDHLWRD